MEPASGTNITVTDDRLTARSGGRSDASRTRHGEHSPAFASARLLSGLQEVDVAENVPAWYQEAALRSLAQGDASNFLTMLDMTAAGQRTNASMHSWSQGSHQHSDPDGIASDGRGLATPAKWHHALSMRSAEQPGNASPLPAYMQMHAPARSPPSPQYSPTTEVDYARQLRQAIHATPDKHPAAPEVSSPVHSCSLTSWNSAPEPTLNPRSARTQSSTAMPAPKRQQPTPFAAEADSHFDTQRPARRQSSSSAARFNPMHASRQQHRLSPSSSLPSRGPFAAASTPAHAGFAQLQQPAMRLAPAHPSDLAVPQLDAAMDMQPAEMQHVSSHGQEPGPDMAAQAGDSVPITPQHRSAWDWSHGSLQSFRQALKHRQQQRLHTGSLQQGRSKHHRPPAKPPSKPSQPHSMFLQPATPSSSQLPRRQAVSLTQTPEQLLPSSRAASPVPVFSLSPSQKPTAASLPASVPNPRLRNQHAPYQIAQHQQPPYQTPHGAMQPQGAHPKVTPPILLSSLACQPTPTPSLQAPQQPVHQPITPVHSSSSPQHPAPAWSASKAVQSLGGPPWTQWSQPLQFSKGTTASDMSRAIKQKPKAAEDGAVGIQPDQLRSAMTASEFFRTMGRGANSLPQAVPNAEQVMSHSVEPSHRSMHAAEPEAPIDELDQATLVWMAGNLASADDHSDIA